MINMKNKKENKTTFELWEVILITLVASLIMSLSTGYVVYRSNTGSNCSTVSNSKYLGEFVTSYNNILNKQKSEEYKRQQKKLNSF